MMKKISRIKQKEFIYKDPHQPRYASLKKVQANPIEKNIIKIVSYNIKFSKKISEAIELLYKTRTLGSADIICLQEMNQEGVIRIAKALKYNYVYYPALFRKIRGHNFGNAILSKWPILSDQKIILPVKDGKKAKRIAVAAKIKAHRRTFMVFSVHKAVFMKSTQRKAQIEKILEAIPPRIKHCIIAGDFNTFTKKNLKLIFDEFASADFKLATGDVSWTYKHWYLLNKKSLLDHIFCKGLTSIRSGNVVNRKPSDHLPIWANLKFEN